MKEQALSIAERADNPTDKLNLLREFLQAFTLRSLHECEAFSCLSFVGGTALRFAYNLPRFSEDLGFSLEMADGYTPVAWMKKLKQDLQYSGFETSLGWNDRKTVHTAWIRLGGIMKEAGIAAMADQKLSIKLEIDTRPPAGAECEKTVINRHLVFALQYHQLPSLMAGKVHALLSRPYPKGRDWYDLLWYLGKRPPIDPNPVLLQNALDQTQGEGAVVAQNWKALLRNRIAGIDFVRLAADVQPFLEHRQDADLLSAEHFRSLLAE